MVRIRGKVQVAAPPADVFDVVADSRNEPSFNPAMTAVELLTPEPIGPGARFRAAMGRAGSPMLVELLEVDRPHRLATRTSSSLMDTTGTLSFAPAGSGTVMRWDWQVRPKGVLRLMGPLVRILGGRFERRIWSGMKEFVEAGHPPSSPASRLST